MFYFPLNLASYILQMKTMCVDILAIIPYTYVKLFFSLPFFIRLSTGNNSLCFQSVTNFSTTDKVLQRNIPECLTAVLRYNFHQQNFQSVRCVLCPNYVFMINDKTQ